MTKLSSVEIHHIYLFDYYNQQEVNPLKEFLYFLKSYQKKSYSNFSYSCEKDSLHQHLSIKENFILDAVPKSLIRDGEDNLNLYLKSLDNPYLKELINELDDLGNKVNELVDTQLKLTSVIKSLLSQSEYIFFLNPDQSLTKDLTNLLKKAIQFEVYQRHRKVIIKTKNHDIWLDITGQIISKCQDKFEYLCQNNPLLVSPLEDERILSITSDKVRAA